MSVTRLFHSFSGKNIIESLFHPLAAPWIREG